MRIAILLTCYNRLPVTIRCLKSIETQLLPPNVTTDIFLVDDQSPDETGKHIQEQFPSVTIIQGTGSLYWVGGMRLCWTVARKKDYDAYLLLNDDVQLFPDYLLQLLETHTHAITKFGKSGVYIGSTRDPQTGATSYGGRKITNSRTGESALVHPGQAPQPCDYAHANILLVMRQVVEEIGILSQKFTHRLADYDYTYTARKAGFPVLVAPGYGGTCTDDHGQNWLPASTSLKERIAYLRNPKHLAYDEYLYYLKKHFPLSVPEAFVKLWLKTLFPVLWDRFKKMKSA